MKKIEAQNKAFEVVDYLAKIRTDKKISAYKIWQLTGLSVSTIGKLENHKRNPTLATLILIAQAIQVDWSEIAKILDND